MKIENPKKAAHKSHRLLLIDLIVLLVIISGIFLFYKLNKNTTLTNLENINKIEPRNASLKQGKVVFFDSSNHKKLDILVEVAENDYQHNKGLMFREDIPENQGMLFTYEDELKRFFWMKNTTIPLDIIYIDATYKIVKIHKNTLPLSENFYPSSVPVQYVVEVRAGFSDRYQVEIGQRISWQKL